VGANNFKNYGLWMFMVDISIVSMTFYNIQKYQQNCRGFKFPDVAIPEFFFGRCPGFPHLVGGLEHVYFPFHIWDVILPID
jgi:hypothetical protein